MFVSTAELSIDGAKFIRRHEGCRLIAYQDSVGVWTIGYGHTAAAGVVVPVRGMAITQTEAEALFNHDIHQYVVGVNNSLRRVCNQPQFDAMVSLCYNIGVHGFAGSSVVRYFNAGETEATAHAFLLWAHPAVLLQRREQERDLFLKGTYT